MPQFWAGFVEDKLYTSVIDTGFGGFDDPNGSGRVRAPSLFTARADARKQFEDVRKVEVRVVSRPRKRKM